MNCSQEASHSTSVLKHILLILINYHVSSCLAHYWLQLWLRSCPHSLRPFSRRQGESNDSTLVHGAILTVLPYTQVIAAARDISKIPASIKDAHALPLDLNAPAAEIHSAVKKALSAYGHIDVLVNNAGYCLSGPIEELRYAFYWFQPSPQ